MCPETKKFKSSFKLILSGLFQHLKGKGGGEENNFPDFKKTCKNSQTHQNQATLAHNAFRPLVVRALGHFESMRKI